MIISASRRTDIPGFYMSWLMERLEEGYVTVQNPINKKQMKRVSLEENEVDGIVLWTKNPGNILPYIRKLESYNLYFQITVNPYGKRVEQNIPPLDKRILDVKTLSRMIGKEYIHWRYDPILLMDNIDVHDHIRMFSDIAERISPYVNGVTISFYDTYRKSAKRCRDMGVKGPTQEQMMALGESIGFIGQHYGLKVETCCEAIDLSQYGVEKGACIDGALLSKIWQRPLLIKKDQGQRNGCLCTSTIDIGMYDSCGHGCIYCYATKGHDMPYVSHPDHRFTSTLLIGESPETYR